MFNNSYVLHELAAALDLAGSTPNEPHPRERVQSDPCLPARLPASGFLEREGERSGPKEILRQLRRTPTPPLSAGSESPVESPSSPVASGRRASTSSTISESNVSIKSWISGKKPKSSTSTWRDPQPYEIFRAIEQKDVMFLMEVRDRAFHLLLKKSGDATPLVHAMRIGESHRDVTIILLGAFSKWVNNLDDQDMADKRTKPLLKALRTNLKLAIDYGLQRSQSDLVASFLQTLVMSEGERWVSDQVSNVAISLRAGTEGKPVQTAETAVRRFATKELGKAEAIAALEDYIANATADLLIMATWSCALDVISGEAIPAYYFARDDRVFQAFRERLNTHKFEIFKLNKRLRWQIRLLETALNGRNTTFRSKVELLRGELDDGPGV